MKGKVSVKKSVLLKVCGENFSKQFFRLFFNFLVHKPSPNGPTFSNPRGYYSGAFVDTRPSREFFRRRKDVMGHPLTMANVIQDSNTSQYHLPREDRL